MNYSIPPPPPRSGPPSPNSPSYRPLHAQQQRGQPHLSPLSTHFSPAQLATPDPGTSIPQSAHVLNTPTAAVAFGRRGYQPSAVSALLGSSGPMNSYNPQEWGSSGTVGGAYVPHSANQARTRGTRDMTGMEARMPEPPPPYSAAPTTDPPNTISQQASPQTAAFPPPQNDSPTHHHHVPTPTVVNNRLSTHLPQHQQYPPSSFPPPPGGTRDRSTSRTRGVLTSISALAAKRRVTDNASPANSPEGLHWQRNDKPAANSVSTPVPQSAIEPGHLGAASSSGRRSVSVGPTGGPGESAPSSRSGSRARGSSNWQPGMPLPPPPPGGPPRGSSGSRSQSVDRGSDREDGVIKSMFAPLPQRKFGMPLSPMPPTPANWKDDDHEQSTGGVNTSKGPSSANMNRGKQESDRSIMSAIEPSEQPSSSAFRDGFGRMAALRDPSAKGIRDRRLESRARSREPQTAVEPSSDNPWAEPVKPLKLADSSTSTIGRRRPIGKSNAASPRNLGHPTTPASARAAPDSAGSTQSPRGPFSAPAVEHSTINPEPTPPFSPDTVSRTKQQSFATGLSSSPAPSAPLSASMTSAPMVSARSTRSERDPTTPVQDSPLSQQLDSVSLPLQLTRREDAYAKLDDFSIASLDRYRALLEKESEASDDTERVEFFAEFIVAESRIRRDRYAEAFESMTGGDVLDLTRDLWRSNSSFSRRGKAPATPVYTTVRPASREGPSAQQTSSASSAGSAAFTPSTHGDSPNSAGGSGRNSRADFPRQGGFQPQLSPIMSMAQSTVPDEDDSRGRAPSRWWDKSDGDGSIANGGRKIELSKRESKYMGVRNLEDMQWDAEPSPAFRQVATADYSQLGPGEYPPEKEGWHEEATPGAYSRFPQTPKTPQPSSLDISRLVTLPPPYPRHHPAVNNKHPELGPLRATLRHIQWTSEKDEFRSRYVSEQVDVNVDPQYVAKRRRDMRRSIQGRVSEGSMSFSEAAASEASFDDKETQHLKTLAKTNFNTFSKTLLNPLSAILNEKIGSATSSLDTVRKSLLDSASTYDPNAMQESGDELPELVEKITLMKWLFEAREQLHKDIFDLQCESDGLYKHVILAPYITTDNTAKITEVNSFFASDGHDRYLSFLSDAKGRYYDFHCTVDESVTRGVEAQLNAFWDIAPSLLELVEQVPSDEEKLSVFAVQVPAAEVDETPAYADYPLQYLYTLLSHTEKSAYQFIESQVNLCCILHEVKLSVSSAKLKVVQAQREKDAMGQGQSTEGIEEVVDGMRRQEDERLTGELKERVQVVEDQWRGALGEALEGCRNRVGSWLAEVGGWDDSLNE